MVASLKIQVIELFSSCWSTLFICLLLLLLLFFALCIVPASSEFLFLFVFVPAFHVRSFLKCLLIWGSPLGVVPGLQIEESGPKHLASVEHVDGACPAVALGPGRQGGV